MQLSFKSSAEVPHVVPLALFSSPLPPLISLLYSSRAFVSLSEGVCEWSGSETPTCHFDFSLVRLDITLDIARGHY